MPEGDTIYRAARALHRALAGHVVTRFESVFPAVTRVAEDQPVVGGTVTSVASRGKHLLMSFSNGLVLHTHMRMNGSWHLYPAGARWQRPARDMRVLVATDTAVAVGFNVPIAELLTPRELARHKDLRALGSDLLDPSLDPRDIFTRMRARGGDAIADVLLNQRVVAGIGNIFKSEILFLAAVEPFTRVELLGDADLARIIAIARRQLAANVMDRSQTLSVATGIRTTRSLDPQAKLWVYGRSGKRCRNCGTPIRATKTGPDARITYWCPQCQR
jgi:endonuclease VIII